MDEQKNAIIKLYLIILMQKNNIALIIGFCLSTLQVTAQDDLLESLNNEQSKKKSLTIASFKGTRLINSPTLEVVGRRALDFRIAHRFGPFNSGYQNFWGIDGPATIKLSFEYSFDGRFMFGIGRSSAQKLYDGFLKYRLLRQTTKNEMPISVTLYASANINGQKQESLPYYHNFTGRMSYAYQIIIGRKFNEHLTLQVSPTIIHYNLVEKSTDKNTTMAVIGAGRLKFTRSMALTFEYGMRLKGMTNDFSSYFNTASLGIDIETGGHIFQMFVTNSTGMNEVQYIPYTNTSWKDGGIRLGFNVSRVFAIGNRKK
jgi:hypothetical protein